MRHHAVAHDPKVQRLGLRSIFHFKCCIRLIHFAIMHTCTYLHSSNSCLQRLHKWIYLQIVSLAINNKQVVSLEFALALNNADNLNYVVIFYHLFSSWGLLTTWGFSCWCGKAKILESREDNCSSCINFTIMCNRHIMISILYIVSIHCGHTWKKFLVKVVNF